MFCKEGVLKNFRKIQWKKLLSESLPNKVAGLHSATSLPLFFPMFPFDPPENIRKPLAF